MTKKKSKQNSSDSRKTKPQVKMFNPFEVHINRKKYDILGMKSKSERGLPGVSRTKSLKKRKGTLLQEYKLKDKKNVFLDRRIGERNWAMTSEDKILARYTAERMKFHSKKSIYNLGDDEELTHKGQTLTEIEKFDNPKSDLEDEDERGDGKLDSSFVEEAHFGGGIFKKVEGESKSQKDLIDQLIAESIKRKAEKQKIKQQTLDLTQKLDSEWKELLPIVTASRKAKSDMEPVHKSDNKFATYDIMSKKLKFEVRGKPSDKLKSEEEIAKEEKEKLEKLEKDRLQRMMSEMETKIIKHRSADDLDDGFDLNEGPEALLTYKNGALSVEEKGIGIDPAKCVSEGENLKEKDEGEDVDEDEEPANAESDSDNLSDLKDSEEEEEEEDHVDEARQLQEQNLKGEGETEKGTHLCATNEAMNREVEEDAQKKTCAMEAAGTELPYTFDIPKEYDDFQKLMKMYNSDYQAVIVERMITCHHPSLKENCKEELDRLYTFLLQHLQDCASDECSMVNCFKILDRLAPWLYDLTQWNPQSCSSGLLEVIKEKYGNFLAASKIYPSVDTLIFLKLVSILFPTSDYRHPVVTPTLIFMQHIQSQCRIRSSVDVSRGLFVASLLLEYCGLSKRYVPEVVGFLQSVFRLVHHKTANLTVSPRLQHNCGESFSLVLRDKSMNVTPKKLSARDLIEENPREEFKINATSLALHLLSSFCDLWGEDQAAPLVFTPFVKILEMCQFGESLKKEAEEVLSKILTLKERNLKMLVWEKRKPIPLRLYDPNIEQVYDLKKYRPMGKKKAERAKLLHKYKREMKGALREIRRDRLFIAKLKYKETVKSDTERQRKVREILGSAAEQAGELNKIMRKKRK